MPPSSVKVPSATLAALPNLLHQHQHRHHILSSGTLKTTTTRETMATTKATKAMATTNTMGMIAAATSRSRMLLFLLVLYSSMLQLACSERDFNFNDSQVPLLEPKDEPKHARYLLHPYVAELSRCHYSDNEIMLSLVLQDHDWNTMNPNKKSKVLTKLAKFFAIPKEFIMLDLVGKHEMYVMQKESLRKGNNKCHKQRQFGRASFVLGCGTTYFSMAEPIINQIGQQMKDGSIDNITGVKFGWWVIWHRTVEMRSHRRRRQASEGSGADQYDDYDYDGEDEEENVESVTEIPVVQQQPQHSHAHRHHHGDVSESDLSESKYVETKASGVVDNDAIINSNAVSKAIVDDGNEVDEEVVAVVPSRNIDEEIVESVSQLESVISKTIENTKHIKDVVMLPTSDVNETPNVVVDIEKELESTRIFEEIQNEFKQKNSFETQTQTQTTTTRTTTTSPSSTTLTIMRTTPTSTKYMPIEFETKAGVAGTTGTLNTVQATKQEIISNLDDINPKYDDNLDVVDDFDDLDTDGLYELPTNRNSINSARAPPAVDVVAEVIESSTLLSTVTKASEAKTATETTTTTPSPSQQFTTTALVNPSSLEGTTQLTAPSQSQSQLLMPIDNTHQETMVVQTKITTTNTPAISQTPPLQSPDSPIFDTSSSSSSFSHSSISSSSPSLSSLSSSSSSSASSSSTPSLLPSSSVTSTLIPFIPSYSSSSSSSSSSTSSSSSVIDVSMLASSTPSSFSAILTTTEEYKPRNNVIIGENKTIVDEDHHDLNGYTTTNTPIAIKTTTTTLLAAIETTSNTATDETPSFTTQQSSSATKSIQNAIEEDDDDEENKFSKGGKDAETGGPTSSVGTDPLPNITSLSSPTSSTTSSNDAASSTTHSTVVLPTELTTPNLPSTDYVEPHIENTPPIIKTRLPKITVIAGKYFVSPVPENIFYDNEDQTNLRLEFIDKEGREVKRTSWIQFNADTREIYGLPVFDTVAKYYYHLRATDSGNETVTETVEIKVQQHRFERSFNHEINITVKINDKSMPSVDWQIKLIKGVAATLGDDSTEAIVVREIPQMRQDPNTATFAYFNETFSTSVCPEAELNDVVRRLDANRLMDYVEPILGIKSITGQLIGACRKVDMSPTKPPAIITKNLPPVPRNQVDRVNATVGHLLVFPVPSDTFYDANDNHLTLSLKTKDHKDIGVRHWLQFDSKNEEFYGIPKSADIGTEEYLLVAEDSGGLTATDALVVVVTHAPKREFSVYFKAYLAIRHEQFNAHLQRKFVESISELFGDKGTHYVQIRSVTTHHDSDGTIVNFYNTTLYKSHNRCPEEEIEAARSVYLMSDNSVRDRVKKALGPDLNLTNVQVIPLGSCHPQTDITHREFIPPKNDEPLLKSTFGDDYFYTFILPAAIIIIMILVAIIIACCLHRRRRKSGKMELGDEEERKSFRTKGIPVIFQDELDEKPEIGNKSPIILKDEKPPLLPPSYNTSNMNGDNDVDEYVPPPAVVVGGREARGKSPATPSYRKPPPYVSP